VSFSSAPVRSSAVQEAVFDDVISGYACRAPICGGLLISNQTVESPKEGFCNRF
jgi:hypothetical protein